MRAYRLEGVGVCKRCGHKSAERRVRTLIEHEDLKKPFVFAYWDWCRDCHFIQLYEQAKIFIATSKAKTYAAWETKAGLKHDREAPKRIKGKDLKKANEMWGEMHRGFENSISKD